MADKDPSAPDADTTTRGQGDDDAGSHDEQRGQENPPWGSDDEFDPKRAWNLIQNMKTRLGKAQSDRDSYKAKVDEYDQAQLSDAEKLTGERDTFKARAEAAEGQVLRMQVAAEKGLTPAQAKRLQGSTQEELEADADDLLASFRPAATAPPSRRPREQYRGGADDPGEPPVETDPAKLAEAVRARGGNRNFR